MTAYSSPNYDSRDAHTIDMLVLHYTGMRSAGEALEKLCNPDAKVSAHYVVEEDGKIHAIVPETARAWHAGISSWRGATNINQRSIGIEIVNPGHEFGYRPFPAAQMKSVAALCRDILARHPIEARNVVGHSDIAPARKQDPGELFDWKTLAKLGIGLWPEPPSPLEGEGGVGGTRHIMNARVDEGTPHPNPPPQGGRELASYGYDTANLPAAITAFQRHFRQNNLDGQWDSECGALLHGLLAAL